MDRTAQRREKLARSLKAAPGDGFLISNATNVRYLSGFTGEDSVLLLTRDKTVIVSDGRFTTQLEQECPSSRLASSVGATMQGPPWPR